MTLERQEVQKQEETEETEKDNRMDDEIAEIVREHDWFAANVFDHSPPFMYTVGLMQTCRHPELIVFGLEGESAYGILAEACGDIRNGKAFTSGGMPYLLANSNLKPIAFREVHPTQHEFYLGFAMGFCRRMVPEISLQAIQIFWPDSTGRFPFEAGCELEVFTCQPRLDLGLTPREIRNRQQRFD